MKTTFILAGLLAQASYILASTQANSIVSSSHQLPHGQYCKLLASAHGDMACSTRDYCRHEICWNWTIYTRWQDKSVPWSRQRCTNHCCASQSRKSKACSHWPRSPCVFFFYNNACLSYCIMIAGDTKCISAAWASGIGKGQSIL